MRQLLIYPVLSIFILIIPGSLFADGRESWVDADDYLHIPMTVAPPVIDGELDKEWYSTSVIKMLQNTANDPDNPEGIEPDDWMDCTGEVRMMWDEAGLYVFAKVFDDQPGETGGDPWMNDCIEIYIDGNNSKAAEWDGVDDGQYRWVYGETPENFTDEICAWQDSDYGYNFELMIPASSCPFPLYGEYEFGMEIQINDRDNDTREHLLRWWGTNHNSWLQPEIWGNAQLDVAEVSDILPCYETFTPPIIDGVSEAIWDEFVLFPTNCWVQDADPFDFESFDSYFSDDWIDFRVSWDYDNFYFIVYHRDEVSVDMEGDDHQNDSIEFFWDGNNDKTDGAYDEVDDHQFRWVINGNGDFTRTDAVWGIGQPRTGEDGLLLEVAVPWEELGFEAREGSYFGVEIQSNDNDDEGPDDDRETMARWWSESNESWHDASYFGTGKIIYNGGDCSWGPSTPIFSPEPGVYKTSVTVSISCFSDYLFYTVDGTDPTASDFWYTIPINVDTTTVIKTIAYQCGMYSDIITAEYIIQGSAVQNNQEESVKEFALIQNYPNPFNTRTIINYDLNKTDHTRLILYDVHGREMAVLVNEVQNTGSHSVMLDADDYPSGVYFYCLESGDQIMTRKMTLLK